MSRVINYESAGKRRTRLTKAIVAAIRELANKDFPDDEVRDLAAFIILSLQAVYETIELSVTPWEKRGYWVKADRFRMEWAWAEQLASEMNAAVDDEDWMVVAQISLQVMQKLEAVNVSRQHRMGKPWSGAWQKLQTEKRNC